MTPTPRILCAVPLLAVALLACAADPEPASLPDDPLEGVLPESAPDPVRPDPAQPEVAPLSAPAELGLISAEPVEGWTGPGGRPFLVARRTPTREAHLTRRIGRESFHIAAREQVQGLLQYPCASCHEGVTPMEDRIPDAHRDIVPLHPSTTGGACATCHLPETVERLTLPDGESADFDHAYRLCAQCHFGQTDAWAAGVHGKRLVGWHGPRVVMGCADCHDPHRPALEPRVPFPGPVLPARTGGRR